MIIITSYYICAFFVPNGKFNSIRRKVMIGSWDVPQGPVIVNWQYDVTNVQKFLDTFPKENKITMTIFVAKVFGYVLETSPDFNGKICFGKFVPHKQCNISLLCDVNNGEDLASILIEDTNKKTMQNIADIVLKKADSLKKKKDAEHIKLMSPFKMIPSSLIKVACEIVVFLTSTLGLNIPLMSLKKDPFGSVVITSLGSLGMLNVTASHNLVSRVPLLVSINKVHQAPIVVDGEIKIRNVMNLNAQIDHRFLDGGRAKIMQKNMDLMFQYPEKYFS